MIRIVIPPEALSDVLQRHETIDLRDLPRPEPGVEVAWLLVPVCPVSDRFLKKPVTDDPPTYIEFASERPNSR